MKHHGTGNAEGAPAPRGSADPLVGAGAARARRSAEHLPTGLAGRIAAALAPRAAVGVAEVRIGVIYTAVELEDGRAGVALTLRAPGPRDPGSTFADVHSLAGCRAATLLSGLGSSDPVETAVGLACANALANDAAGGEPGDVLDHLRLEPSDHVAMIGHFVPMVQPLERRVGRLSIFELIDEPDGRLLPAARATELLPRCDVAIVTATTIVGGTIDRLLQAAASCRDVVLLGASTPLLPEVFASTCVSMLAGVRVADAGGVLRVVAEAGGMRKMRPFVRKVSLRLR